MAYTELQELRKIRARNKGLNKKLAATLREMAALLENKGPKELTSREVRAFQTLRTMITNRLLANALTQSVQDVLNGTTKSQYQY